MSILIALCMLLKELVLLILELEVLLIILCKDGLS